MKAPCPGLRFASFRALGFTLVELLVAVFILTALLGLMFHLPGVLTSNRRMAAAQQMAAALEEARAQALRGNGAVFVAFSPVQLASSPSSVLRDPCRQYAIFREQSSGDTESALVQVSEWRSLPEGIIFAPDANARPGSSTDIQWKNLYTAAPPKGSGPLFHLHGNAAPMALPSLGFGALGELIHPDQEARGSLYLVLAEGLMDASGRPQIPNPDANVIVEIRRRTGKTLIHP